MSIQIVPKAFPVLMHLRGEGLDEVLASLGASDLDIFQYQFVADGQFVAKLGNEEIFVCVEQPLDISEEKKQYAFQRGDAIFELSGDWKGLMAEVCIYDFRQTQPGDFLMVLIAGVSAWLLIPEEGAPLVLGCDPTYGHYFYETLVRQLEVSPFLKMECQDDD